MLVAVSGPDGSGKTTLAMALLKRIKAPICRKPNPQDSPNHRTKTPQTQ